MATFEERELVDYAFKKIENIMKEKDDSFMIKDLNKMHMKLKSTEERLRKIIEKIENLENRIRILERESISNKFSDSSSD